MKIAVVGGAGAMGAGVIKDLLAAETEGVEKVIIIDRHEEGMRALKDELKDNRLEFKVIDVKDKKKLSKVLEEVDVCANEVNIWTYPDLARDVMIACLDAQCRYTDLGLGSGPETIKIKEEFHEKFVERNISAILGMGTGPGTTNIFAKYCAERLDKVEKIEMYAALERWGLESPIFVPYYDIPSMCAEYGESSHQFIDGELKKMPPFSGEQIVVFPEPIGKVRCYHTIHPESAMVSYTFKDKGVKEATWRQKRSTYLTKIIRSLMACGFGDIEPLEIKGVDIVPREFLKALIARNVRKNKEKTIEPEKECVICRVVVEGEKSGRKLKYTVDRIGGHGTSITQSYAAQSLAKGEIKAGAWFPEECTDPTDYLKAMKKKGFKFSVLREEEI